MTEVSFPFHFDEAARTATSGESDHIRQMIEQLLFTNPGERVNRPDFGTGLMQMIFDPNSNEMAAATQFLVQGALQQWLGDQILVESVNIQNDGQILRVIVRYVLRRDQQHQVAQFSRGAL